MTAAPTRRQKQYWVNLLTSAGARGVEVVVLMPPKHVAYERMRSREVLAALNARHSPHSWGETGYEGARIDELVRGIDNWYMRYEPYVGEKVVRT